TKRLRDARRVDRDLSEFDGARFDVYGAVAKEDPTIAKQHRVHTGDYVAAAFESQRPNGWTHGLLVRPPQTAHHAVDDALLNQHERVPHRLTHQRPRFPRCQALASASRPQHICQQLVTIGVRRIFEIHAGNVDGETSSRVFDATLAANEHRPANSLVEADLRGSQNLWMV